MVHISERSLEASERLEIGGRRDQAVAAGRRAIVGFGSASLLVCGVLAVLTLVVSDAPPVVVVGFWAALAVLFALWTGLPARRHWLERAASLEQALVTNRARVTRINTSRVVEFEEVEDEGACFAFDAGPGRTIVVAGQEFYADDTFPNSDFSIVEVQGPAGAVDVVITRAGRKVEPERRVSAAQKRSMELPDHLEIVDVAIDRIGR
jgi:hypothetical protein